MTLIVRQSSVFALFAMLAALASPGVGALETDNGIDDPANGSAGPVTREGNQFWAEGTAARPDDSSCIWAASRAFVASWDACDAAKFANCDGARPIILEKGPHYCHVKSVVTGS